MRFSKNFQGFLPSPILGHTQKIVEKILMGLGGRGGWERKKFTPHFLPHVASVGNQIFTAEGSQWALLKFQTWRP